VKPGITGWAQINGRNAIDWQTRFALDVWYSDNLSFNVDIKILYKTFKKVFMRDGVKATGQVTVEYFKGNLE
jgi:lipopolysaccharide/colanic/teichoic acid biosynthesis glycosyltransferase